MALDVDAKMFYKQYDIDYKVLGKGHKVHRAKDLRLNLYFDSVRRGMDIMNLMSEIEMQCRTLQEMKDNELPVDGDLTAKRLYRWFDFDYDEDTRLIQSFTENSRKVSAARRTSGFYAIVTLGMDLTAMQAWDVYELRDEQEKYFQQMKSQLGYDRQRN